MSAIIRIKPGVNVDGFQAVTWRAAAACADVFARYGYEFWITSGREGDHMEGSLHGKGLAFDARSRHIRSRGAKLKVLAEMKGVLGSKFDAIFEEADPEHFHIEYDPKTGGKTCSP